MPAVIALVGLPNAGKSTLFNRLIGSRRALVSRRPGMTRDVRDEAGEISGHKVRLLDTAGLPPGDSDPDSLPWRDLTRQAITRADIAVMVVDARAGAQPGDHEIASLLRRAGVATVVAANKTDVKSAAPDQLWELGLGEPVAVSAEHGTGVADLEDAIAALLDGRPEAEEETRREAGDAGLLRLVIIGRPNTGKSTLANALVDEPRLATGAVAGMTRDAIELRFSRGNRDYALVDTAGLRRHKGARDEEESLAAEDAMRAAGFGEVAVLMVDATCPFEQQDLRLADAMEKEGRAVVLAISKWDLVRDRKATLEFLRAEAARLLPNIAGAPLAPVSALRGQGLDGLLKAALQARGRWQKRVSTGRLNRWLREAVEAHPPPAPKGRRLRLRYLAQTNVRPPTFALFVSRPKELGAAYRRYLVQRLRKSFGFEGVPIRLMLRSADNPYAPKGGRRASAKRGQTKEAAVRGR